MIRSSWVLLLYAMVLFAFHATVCALQAAEHTEQRPAAAAASSAAHAHSLIHPKSLRPPCPEGFTHLLGSKPGQADPAAGGKVTGTFSQ